MSPGRMMRKMGRQRSSVNKKENAGAPKKNTRKRITDTTSVASSPAVMTFPSRAL